VGSALECYDFAIYGTASALVFKHLFFSGLGNAVGLVAIFATYAVGFFARPLGGLFFGSLGDRHGRKTVPIVTVELMGGSSFAIGLLPTYHTAGVWSPVPRGADPGRGLHPTAAGGEPGLAELFGARHRYTGVAVGREFSAIVAGGVAPLLRATLLLAFMTPGGLSPPA
jgi:MFS family permease